MDPTPTSRVFTPYSGNLPFQMSFGFPPCAPPFRVTSTQPFRPFTLMALRADRDPASAISGLEDTFASMEQDIRWTANALEDAGSLHEYCSCS